MPTTALYVHGLESGPRGKKTLALEEAGVQVVAGQMPCGRKAILRDPVVIAVLLAIVAGVGVGVALRGVTGFIIAMVAIAVLQRFVRPPLLRRMFRRSVAVQVKLLETNAIDVVVGSSFGGAVAVELLARGAWKGPTVLLCPAHRLVAGRGWMPSPVLPADASKIVVVHGREDETVPLEHSRSLVRGTNARLLEVEDDHRLTATSTAENLGAWVRLAASAV